MLMTQRYFKALEPILNVLEMLYAVYCYIVSGLCPTLSKCEIAGIICEKMQRWDSVNRKVYI